MNALNLDEGLKAINKTSKQWLSFFEVNKQLKYNWNIETPEQFAKIMFNLLLQEQYKPLADGGYIPFETILDNLKKVMSMGNNNNFPKQKYDYNKFEVLPKESNSSSSSLSEAKEAFDKYRNDLENLDKHSLISHYLLFANVDDTHFLLADNEETNLELVFGIFSEGCHEFGLNPMRLIRLFREKAQELNQSADDQVTKYDKDRKI